jgi:broad specificity phosphatase PhoE
VYEAQAQPRHSRFLIEARRGQNAESEHSAEAGHTDGARSGRKTAGDVSEIRPARYVTRLFATAAKRTFSSFAARFAAVALVLSAVVAHAQPSTIILVRHAEKASLPADDPALSPAGQQRARDLASALADAHVSTVIATQFQRTQATARPIAEAVGQTTIVVPATSDPRGHAEAVAAKARSTPAGGVVLIVGHSNTVPLIIAALGGPKMPDLCDAEYANLFVLEMPPTGAPRLIRGKYGVPDAPESDNCARTMRRP